MDVRTGPQTITATSKNSSLSRFASMNVASAVSKSYYRVNDIRSLLAGSCKPKLMITKRMHINKKDESV